MKFLERRAAFGGAAEERVIEARKADAPEGAERVGDSTPVQDWAPAGTLQVDPYPAPGTEDTAAEGE